MKRAILLFALLLSGCDDNITGDKVILIRNGLMETSGVAKFGSYCWVSWYHGIDHVILRADGTAVDPPFYYHWKPLNLSEREDIDGFFKRNGCEEPRP